MACEGFIRQFIERFGPEGAYSHDVTERVINSETRQITLEEQQLFRNLSISFYTNASHREKMDQFQNALESALEAKRYQEKLTLSNFKDKSFMETIELKIELLRSKLNNTKTFKENSKLIKQRALENMSKHKESTSRPGSANLYSTLDKFKSSKLSATNHQSSRAPPISQVSGKRPISKSQSRKEVILKNQPVKVKEVVKDPATKKNYDSIGIRVTALYLHNEYFHGNYSNGVQMFKATSNNEKFYPYKTLNPIPNDKAYLKKTREEAMPGHLHHSRASKGKKSRPTSSVNHQVDTVGQDLNDDSETEQQLVQSFDSNPAEVIELYSPPTEPVKPGIPDRPKSAAQRQKEYQLEHGKHPGTVHLQDDDQAGLMQANTHNDDAAKQPSRSKSRSNTYFSQKPEPVAAEDPNFFDE